MSLFIQNNVFYTFFFLCAFLYFSYNSFASCPDCLGNIKTYRTGATNNVNSGNNNTNNSTWDPNGTPGSSDIARFTENRSFTWLANNESIRGIILEGNSKLTLDRPNEGDNPSFVIGGTPQNRGCIIIKNGSTLTLRYISNLVNVNICVEDGGKLVVDSRSESRNDYLFNGVDITLNGPNAKIEFGEADINVGNQGLGISGYTGQGCTLNADGSYSLPSPPPNITADPSKTNIQDFCEFLDAAGFSILPVKYLYFNSIFNITDTMSFS